jgi:hypothetical protein
MNHKKMIVSAAILGIAVLILVLAKLLTNREPAESSLQFFPGISEKSIGAVIIKDATDWVKLQRKGDKWVMIPRQVLSALPSGKKAGGLSSVIGADTAPLAIPAGAAASEYPGDSATIASLLENVLKCKKDIIVSENPAKQATFEVDSAKGILVEVLDLEGKSLGKVIIGKNAADYSSNYVRGENSSAVYQVSGISKYAFGSDHKRWADKSIMKFEKAAVKQVSIAKKGAPAIVLSLEGDSTKKSWNITQPIQKPADSSKVDELLSGLSNLMASEYEDSAYTDSATGLSDPSIAVAVTLTGGSVRSIAYGKAKAGASKFWVRVPEKPFVFLVNEYDQKKVDKKPEDFQKQELKPIVAVPAAKPKMKTKK